MTDESQTFGYTRAQGWAEAIAQIPEFRNLIEFAGSVRESLPEDEKLALISEHASETGGSIRSVVEGVLPSEMLDADCEQLVHLLVSQVFARSGPMTVWEALSKIQSALDWDTLIARFALSRARGDSGDLFETLFDGLVFDGVMFSNSDHPMPYVIAASMPKTTRPEHLKEYQDRMRQVFKGIPNPTGDTVAFLAECIRVRDSRLTEIGRRLTPAEIARELVNERYPEARVLDDDAFSEDYGDEYSSLHDRVRQAFSRDRDRVTETSRSVSQEED